MKKAFRLQGVVYDDRTTFDWVFFYSLRPFGPVKKPFNTRICRVKKREDKYIGDLPSYFSIIVVMPSNYSMFMVIL